MKLHAIICKVLSREVLHTAAHSQHKISLTAMPSDLHNEPDKLRSALQQEIDLASGGKNDYILLGYGLCSRGTSDIEARDTPLVIPRAHDCITLLLGSMERYISEFREHPGTYYFSSGWIEQRPGELRNITQRSQKDLEIEARFAEYKEKFGEDNALYLIEQESLWCENYNRAAFIDTSLGDTEHYRRYTMGTADSNGWEYVELKSDMSLIERLLSGEWDADSFLVVEPGQKTREDVTGAIISIE